jgi:hypothetical protein
VKYLYRSIVSKNESISQYSPHDYPFTDYQWEVLCSEYLRGNVSNELRIDYLLTPVGRTMKDIDIDGASDSIHVYGQVSLSTNLKVIDKKVHRLKSAAHGYNSEKKLSLVYFGPKKLKEYFKKTYNTVSFISTEDVLYRLKDIGILKDMLPF